MARRTKDDAAKTRADIMNAALDEFYENGYTNASLNSIAKRTGNTKGAIYWHFKSKKDLFTALHREVISREDHSCGGFNQFLPSLITLQRLTKGFIGKVLSDPFMRKYYAIVLLRMEWTQDLKPFRDQFLKESSELAEYYSDTLKACIERGEVAPEIDPVATASALVSLQNGLLADTLFLGEKPTSEHCAAIEAGISVFFRGLVQFPGRPK